MTSVKIKRIYEEADPDDGYRVLIDRLWPRGVKKEEAKVEYWAKQIAPSRQLREWFDHDPEKFDAFSRKYHQELLQNSFLAEFMHKISQHPTVTLLFGAKDEQHNQAISLKKFLEN